MGGRRGFVPLHVRPSVPLGWPSTSLPQPGSHIWGQRQLPDPSMVLELRAQTGCHLYQSVGKQVLTST